MDALATLTVLALPGDAYSFQFDWTNPSPLFSAQQAGSPAAIHETVALEPGLRQELRQQLDAAVELLRLRGGNTNDRTHDDSALESLGKLLYAHLMPPVIQQALERLPSNIPLLVTANESTIPWELLHDGRGYLALQRPLGRRLLSATPRRVPPLRTDPRPRILIIADPQQNLPAAAAEAENLINLFDAAPDGLATSVLAGPMATLAEVRQHLAGGRFDLIHFAGHASGDALLLAEGALSAGQIKSELRGQPLIFLNGCQTAYDSQSSRTLAAAFIEGGALAVVGTQWNVDDDGSNDFAHWFYSRLLEGKPLGEALQSARRRLHTASTRSHWAHYTLYGDPRLLVFGLNRREVRQATALVTHLGGLATTEAPQKLEQAAGMQEAAMTQLIKTARRLGGTVQPALGNTLLTLFGVPDRHEDDARRAVLTALEMNQVIADLNRQQAARLLTPLSLQAGISTSYVISTRTRTGAAFDYQLFGVAVDLAGQLGRQAGTGQVLIDETTQRQSGWIFDGEPDLIAAIPGHDAPIVAYRIDATTPHRKASSRLSGRQPANMPLFGRDRELDDLQRWWSEAQTGLFRFVEIAGPPGAGKTRLVEAFHDSIDSADPDGRRLQARSEGRDQDTSYALLAQIIRRLAGLEAGDSEAIALPQLKHMVDAAVAAASGQSLPGHHYDAAVQEGMALLSQVIGYSFSVPTIATLAPDLRQKKLSGLVQALLQDAGTKPFVLVLEDMHWADDASIEILETALSRLARVPFLCLLTYRTEWTPPWSGRPWSGATNYRQVHLDELDPSAQMALLDQLLGDGPDGINKAQVLEHTGGNPLFIEEMAHSLAEGQWLLDEQWLLDAQWLPDEEKRSPSRHEVALAHPPDRLETVIQVRLDRLPPSARNALHFAAIIGQLFDFQLLYQLHDRVNRETLESDLDLLIERSLITQVGGYYPNFTYEFSHALIRQVAYENMLESRRRPLHRILGRLLESEQSLTPSSDSTAPLLAYHFYHSDDRSRAIHWGLLAAERAAGFGDNRTALHWFARVRDLLASFDVDPPTLTEAWDGSGDGMPAQWRLRMFAGAAAIQWRRGDFEQAENNFESALALAKTGEPFTPGTQADLYYQLVHLYEAKGEFDQAWDALMNGVAVLDGRETLEAARLYIWRGLIHHRQGQPNEAIAWCKRGIAIAATEGSLHDQAMGHNLLSIVYRVQGKLEPAEAAALTSLNLYTQEDYVPGIERATSNLACIFQDQEEWGRATELFEESRLLSEKTGEVYRISAAYTNLGEVARLQGDLAAAVRWFDQGQDMALRHGHDEIAAILLMNMGAVLSDQAQPIPAQQRLSESRMLFDQVKSRQYLAELTRYQGESELALGDLDAAEKWAQESLELAEELGQEANRAAAQALLDRIHTLRAG